MRTLSTLLLLWLHPAQAQSPMTAAEFESYTTGKTLYFDHQGERYGGERYLKDRYVEWSFLDGNCQPGRWYDAGKNHLCFVYEDIAKPQCWQFFKTPDGLQAQFQGPGNQSQSLYEAQPDATPMSCTGPGLGV